MSNKENLIFALASAENENKEIGIGYVANKGIAFMVTVIPEIMVYDKSVAIYDAGKGMGCYFAIDLDEDIIFEENPEDYIYEIRTISGIISIYFRKA